MSIRDEIGALLGLPIGENDWDGVFARINAFGRPTNNERRQMLLIILKRLDQLEKEIELNKLLNEPNKPSPASEPPKKGI